MSRCLIGNLRGVDPLDCRAIHPHPACAEGGDSRDYVEVAKMIDKNKKTELLSRRIKRVLGVSD